MLYIEKPPDDLVIKNDDVSNFMVIPERYATKPPEKIEQKQVKTMQNGRIFSAGNKPSFHNMMTKSYKVGKNNNSKEM